MAENDDAAAAPPDPREYAGPIQDFFQQVAAGVIKAQQDLDQKSQNYLDGKPVVPTVFRIPKVTAEFMLAAEKSSSTGINFIVAVSKARREAMQQKLSFEIIAVPPPLNPPQEEEFGDAQPDEAGGGAAPARLAAQASAGETASPNTTATEPPAATESPAEAGDEPSSAFPRTEFNTALFGVTNDGDADDDEKAIAQELQKEDNAKRWVPINFGTHWVVLCSPKPASRKTLLIAVATRDFTDIEVYTNELPERSTKFKRILERLAVLAAQAADART